MLVLQQLTLWWCVLSYCTVAHNTRGSSTSIAGEVGILLHTTTSSLASRWDTLLDVVASCGVASTHVVHVWWSALWCSLLLVHSSTTSTIDTPVHAVYASSMLWDGHALLSIDTYGVSSQLLWLDWYSTPGVLEKSYTTTGFFFFFFSTCSGIHTTSTRSTTPSVLHRSIF
uniref:NADH dehydrogenase subunit 9 n=1 Tax=Lacrimia lanifica TaxID=2016125 RepID=A0A6G5ZVE5_9EUGL|nr:NADH dehydrogenase subunit 9 [Lacrimia lanifica]